MNPRDEFPSPALGIKGGVGVGGPPNLGVNGRIIRSTLGGVFRGELILPRQKSITPPGVCRRRSMIPWDAFPSRAVGIKGGSGGRRPPNSRG